jgi:hypothetical protein
MTFGAKIGFGFLLLLLFSFTSLLTPHRTLVNTHKINKCAKLGSIDNLKRYTYRPCIIAILNFEENMTGIEETS